MKINLNHFNFFITENLLFFILLSFIFCIILLVLYSILDVFYKTKEVTSSSPYECGFLPYTEANIDIDINFGAIAILFIIFDLETIMLLPIITNHSLLNISGYSCIVLFLFTFIVGLYYEIKSQIIIL